MKRWEYRRVLVEGLEYEENRRDRHCDKYDEDEFDRLGDDGWELVSIYSSREDTSIYALFRREKSEWKAPVLTPQR